MNDKYICTFFMPWEQKSERYKREEKNFAYDYRLCEAKTLEEAYELNQARNSRVMGGMMWMRLGNARVKTVIDLSELGLDQIEETDHVFKSGRCVLWDSWSYDQDTWNVWRRNCRVCPPHCWSAVSKSGDSRRKYIWKIWIFRCTDGIIGLDTFVELYNGGIIRLSEFVNRKKIRIFFSLL